MSTEIEYVFHVDNVMTDEAYGELKLSIEVGAFSYVRGYYDRHNQRAGFAVGVVN